jgi:hypothetical protein
VRFSESSYMPYFKESHMFLKIISDFLLIKYYISHI